MHLEVDRTYNRLRSSVRTRRMEQPRVGRQNVRADQLDELSNLYNDLRRADLSDLFYFLANVGSILFGVFYVFELTGRFTGFPTIKA